MESEESKENEENIFTKNGNLRKRKKFNTNSKDRNLVKNTKLLLKHKVILPCNANCKKKMYTEYTRRKKT